MRDISKQEYIPNKRIPQCTKMRIYIDHNNKKRSHTQLDSRKQVIALNNSNNEQKSPAYSYNSYGRLQKPQYINILLYIGCISENAIFMQFLVGRVPRLARLAS